MDNTVTDSTFVEEIVQEVEDELKHPVNEQKVCVVVEGADDIGLYGKFLDEDLMFFFDTGDCVYIPPIIRELSTYSNRLIGIKDADFDHLRKICYPEQNLFLTDCHDCEMMMLKQADVVADIVYEYTHKRIPGIIANIFSALDWYSYLQYYNIDVITAANDDGIRFKGLKMINLYDGSSAISCTHCLDTVRNFANNARLALFPSHTDLQKFRDSKQTSDAYNLHRGHDVMHCIAIDIRNNSYSGCKKVSYDTICEELRIRYQFKDFQSTKMYQDLDNWMCSVGHRIWKYSQ